MVHLPVLRRHSAGAIGALLHDEWAAPLPDPAGTRRARIWDIAPNLHCSVIGTCLTTGELRQFFVKLGDADARTASDHSLHGCASRCGDDAGVGRLDGRRLLYVGGRPGLIDALRTLTERRGGALLAHDGGVEDSATLLPGLISQADIAFFPVDCVSHAAAGRIKTLCRQSGKPFVPLRSASVASFLAAIAAPPNEARDP